MRLLIDLIGFILMAAMFVCTSIGWVLIVAITVPIALIGGAVVFVIEWIVKAVRGDD